MNDERRRILEKYRNSILKYIERCYEIKIPRDCFSLEKQEALSELSALDVMSVSGLEKIIYDGLGQYEELKSAPDWNYGRKAIAQDLAQSIHRAMKED